MVLPRRVFACLVDCGLVGLLCLVPMLPVLAWVRGPLPFLMWLLALLVLFCVLYTLYVAPLDGLYGGTLGKRVWGIEVVSLPDGSRPGLWRGVMRALTFLATDGLLGIFVALGSPARQRPGDMVVGTVVVRRRGAAS